MDNQNQGNQEQDPNLQKKPQGTDVNRDKEQKDPRDQAGNKADQGDQNREDERKSA